MILSLVDMKPGQSGLISAIKGGPGFVTRLNQLGLREGKMINKVSSVFSRGPVTVRVDNYHLAIGYGKAIRIMVEVNSDEKTGSDR